MDSTPNVLSTLHSLIRRGNCVQCPNTVPSCPVCPPDHSCVQVSGNCNNCASRQCVPTADAAAAPAPTPHSSTNVGAIVGGVVGGVVVIALATYLIWRFCIKPRRAQYEDEYPEEYSDDKDTYENGCRPSHTAHRSHHSVRSMASTVMTRASNVIQIAFIPGITDRSGSDAPNSAVPPVPPVPLELADTQPATPYDSRQIPPSPYTDASTDHYFMPQDLRQSRFSEFSDESDNRSTRHYSIASSLARASFASAVYGQSTVSPPVQIAQSGKANVVSVSSSQRATPGGTIPEIPSIDYLKYGSQAAKGGVDSSANSMIEKEPAGDFKAPHNNNNNNNTHTATTAQILSAKSSATLLNSTPPSHASPLNPHTSTVPPLPTNIPGVLGTQRGPSNLSHNTSASDIGSTSGASESKSHGSGSGNEGKKRRTSQQHLTAAIAEATKRASRQPTHGGLGSVPVPMQGQGSGQRSREESATRAGATGGVGRDPSPFSDDHEVKESREETEE